MAGIVGEFHQRQACAVVYLGGEHEADALLRHGGVQVDDALDVLHGVAVAVAVALAAVDQAGGAAPYEGGKALEGVPGVHHGVQVFVRRIDVQVAELFVPVILQGFPLSLGHLFRVRVGVQKRAGGLLAFLPQQEGQGDALAGLELDHRVERAAGIAVEVHAVVQPAVHHGLGRNEALRAQKPLAPARIAFDLGARHARTEAPSTRTSIPRRATGP